MSRALRLEIQFKMLAGLLARVTAEMHHYGGPRLVERRILDPIRQVGSTKGQEYAQRFTIEGSNAVAAGTAAMVGAETYDATFQVGNAEPRRFHARITSCPRRDAAEELGTEAVRAGCDACGSFLEGLARSVSPDVRFSMEERMGWGDRACVVRAETPPGRPGSTALRVPAELRFLSLASRRELAIEHLAAQIRAITLQDEAGEQTSSASRSLAHAGMPVGVRDGTRALDVFSIKAQGTEAAGQIVEHINKVLEVNHQIRSQSPEGYAWRTLGCSFKSLMPPERTGPAADRVCTMCRSYHEGLANATGVDHEVTIHKRLAAGDDYCSFEAVRRPRSRWIQRTRRGQVDYGLARVALITGRDTFPLMWKLYGGSLRSLGEQASRRLVQQLIRDDLVSKDDDGLERALEHWAEAGWGDFRVERFSLAAPSAHVVLTNGFESEAVGQQGGDDAGCHFTQGVVRGVVEELTGRRGLSVTEEACRIRGDPQCTYRVERRDKA